MSYTKADLAKLKDSKPVHIIAHTHETIVPVVYAGMVNRFLESKGVKLPLTHHQLAAMKHDAGVSGYAKGTMNLQQQKVSQKVVIHLGEKKRKKKAKGRKRTGVTAGAALPALPTQTPMSTFSHLLRPDNYSNIRPLITTFTQPAAIPDYRREADEHLSRERQALEKYKKELESRSNSLNELEAKKTSIRSDKTPLREDTLQIPLRNNDFDQAPPAFAMPAVSSRATAEDYAKLTSLEHELAQLESSPPAYGEDKNRWKNAKKALRAKITKFKKDKNL